MFIDYHVHLDKVEWSMNSIEEMCNKARESGVDKVGVVVHTKVLQGFEPLYSHVISDGTEHKKLKFNKNIESYINLLQYSKDRGYPVQTGIEVCYSPEGEDFLRQKLKEYPFDYIIGSVHLIKNMHYKTAIDFYGDKELVGRMYYELVLKAIESKLFNIIGHIEIARREGIPGLEHYPEILNKICKALILNNCAIEINTKWLTKHGYLVPDNKTLMYMAGKGIKLVFGSDAHHKSRIGFAKDMASMVVKEAGHKGFAVVD